MRGDMSRHGQLDAWVAGHDIVLDAAAPHPLGLFLTDHPAVEDPAAGAARRMRALLDAVARYGAQLAYVSTFTTLPRSDGRFAAAAAQWRRRIYPYFRVKYVMEAEVLEAAHRGIPAVVVNPSVFFGPWNHDASSFVAMVLEQRLPGIVPSVINVIDVRDVAWAVRAALDARRYGAQIPLAGHDIALDELAGRIAAVGGVPRPTFPANLGLAVMAGVWIELAWAATGRPAPATVGTLPLVADAGPMAQSREQRALGLRIRSLDETIGDSVRWHLTRQHE